eukprot:9372275-Karenia_brevis.AAC.1
MPHFSYNFEAYRNALLHSGAAFPCPQVAYSTYPPGMSPGHQGSLQEYTICGNTVTVADRSQSKAKRSR